MATGKLYKTKDNIEKFVNMIILGCSRQEICKAIGIKRATNYTWLDDPKIATDLEEHRTEIKDVGMRYIKGRYKKIKGTGKLISQNKCDIFL